MHFQPINFSLALLIPVTLLALSACSAEALPLEPAVPGQPMGRPTPRSSAPALPGSRDEEDTPPCDDCRLVDLAAGNAHTCALKSDGSIVCWGGNRWGQLGDGGARHGDCSILGEVDFIDCSDEPVTAHGIDDAIALSVGGTSACTLSAMGEVSCWGRTFANIGAGMAQPLARHLPSAEATFRRTVDVSDGSAHTCAVDEEGAVWCRGRNWAGQLGTGDFQGLAEALEVLHLPPAVDVEVSSTGAFTCAITDDGVYCWGDNGAGQLGDGGRHESCFDGSAPYDCSTAPVRVANLDGVEVAELSLGNSHACAITQGGDLYCWGAGANGQLGQSSFTASAVPVPVSFGIDMVVAIGSGNSFSCALTEDGRVACFGDNAFGQLGDGQTNHGQVCRRGSSVADCAGEPVWAEGITDATHLAVGSNHACVLSADAVVSCWGFNHQKQLGDGTREERTVPVVSRATAN